jgi:hypothetical protein
MILKLNKSHLSKQSLILQIKNKNCLKNKFNKTALLLSKKRIKQLQKNHIFLINQLKNNKSTKRLYYPKNKKFSI